MQVMFLVLLFIFGACFGSFLCCQARRLHLKETKKSRLGSRSVCLSCRKKLAWYDNIPIISWLILKGKCRSCGKKIGTAEPLSEIGVGLAFLFIGLKTFIFANIDIWPSVSYYTFAYMLIFVLILSFLAIYDGLYGELPTIWLYVALVWSLIPSITTISTNFDWPIISPYLFSVAILGGLYLILYLVSKGQWVGDGDWLLATAIALVLGHPWLALIALFLANLLAVFYALPHLKKNQKIHLGPFLVVAFVITIML